MSDQRLDAARSLAISPQQRVGVALGRAVNQGLHRAEQVLKPHGLTTTQYNVLRILNGAGPEGLCGTEIGRRLLSQVPDVTRLLDRVEDAGLIVRVREPSNRRYVTARLTDAGRAKLLETTPLLDALHRAQFRRFSPEQLETFAALVALMADPRAADSGGVD